jgi:glycosyltransferase involved in cell wall biosynthesis
VLDDRTAPVTAARAGARREPFVSASVAKVRFSIITPVHNPAPRILQAALDSVHRQTFADWEHCIVDDGSSDPQVEALLDDAVRRDSRLRVQRRPDRGGIAIATNDALALAGGEFVVFLDHDDELHASAIATVSAHIDRFEDVDYLYTDEDKLDERGRHFDPFLKPDWSPDRFRTQMYTAHLSVVRRSVVQALGGLDLRFEGAQDWDLIFRVTEQARRVVHVPEVLYHWRAHAGSTARHGSDAKPYAHTAARRAIDAHLGRTGIEAAAEPLPGFPGNFQLEPRLRRQPLVSIVMPTAGGRRSIDGCDVVLAVHAIESIVRRSTYATYEIVVVVDDHVTRETRTEIERAGNDRVAIVRYDAAFNFSDKLNVGAAAAHGEHLLLLNDDIEVLPNRWMPGDRREGPSDWIERLLVYSLQQDVGAVGGKLYFPDGRLQHAGVIFVDGAPAHALYLAPGDEPGYFGAAILPSTYLAVTAACLMTRRQCFERVNGFDIELPLNYNDVAYGLALRDAGFRAVFDPDVRLLHFESATRTPGDVHPDELSYLRERWPDVFIRDPYYPPGFVAGRTDFRVPPYRRNGSFVPPGTFRSDLVRAQQLLSEGGPRLLAQRLAHRLRRTTSGMP